MYFGRLSHDLDRHREDPEAVRAHLVVSDPGLHPLMEPAGSLGRHVEHIPGRNLPAPPLLGAGRHVARPVDGHKRLEPASLADQPGFRVHVQNALDQRSGRGHVGQVVQLHEPRPDPLGELGGLPGLNLADLLKSPAVLSAERVPEGEVIRTEVVHGPVLGQRGQQIGLGLPGLHATSVVPARASVAHSGRVVPLVIAEIVLHDPERSPLIQLDLEPVRNLPELGQRGRDPLSQFALREVRPLSKPGL
jgi:hypothetical protein